MWWNPELVLDQQAIEKLKEELDHWLKRDKRISNYEYASYEREKRKKWLELLLKQVRKPTLRRLAEEIRVLEDNGVTPEGLSLPAEIIQDLREFFEERLGIYTRRKEQEDTTKDKVATLSSSEGAIEHGHDTRDREPIGRVAPTLESPTTPSEFSFWVQDNENLHLSLGNIISTGNGITKVVGLVTELTAVSDVRESLDSFYAHAFGRPELELPTRIPVVLTGKAEVVRRSDGHVEPIRGTWPVFFANSAEIREAYMSEIPDEYEVLAGFTYDGSKNPVPIGIDARYVVGYEAAHVNISGASGLATKTSYALFLIQSLLAYAQKHYQKFDGGIAAIAFNVKEADLMFIDDLPPNWERLEQERFIKHPKWGPTIQLWREARNHYGIDPIKWLDQGVYRFFAPKKDGGGVVSYRNDRVEVFYYGLKSLTETGTGTFYTLFDPEDLDEKMISLIGAFISNARQEERPFRSLLSELRRSTQSTGRQGEWITFGDSTHHKATVNKFLNRIENALSQMKGWVVQTQNDDKPIPVDEIQSGQLWVIDLSQLTTKGQRLVFQAVVRQAFRLLETRKASRVGTSNFSKNEPGHIVIFVDELNKFVPSGREFSPIKGDIIEIAARGRSIGLSLIGAQQLASNIDEEVLANTSTFVLGRSHPVEVKKPPYGWVPDGLKRQVSVLNKGTMLVWHSLHSRPVIVNFPIPLHQIKKMLGSSLEGSETW